MHSAGLELAKLTYNRLEDNLTRHRGDRFFHIHTSTSTSYSEAGGAPDTIHKKEYKTHVHQDTIGGPAAVKSQRTHGSQSRRRTYVLLLRPPGKEYTVV